MITLSPKINKVKNHIWLYIRKYSRLNGKQKDELIKIGDSVIVEGGPSTGKTRFLNETKQKLIQANVPVISIKGGLPLLSWVKEYKLFGKNLEKRIDLFLSSLPKDYYLIIDDAEKVNDSRKLEVVFELLANARGVIVGCGGKFSLNPKLRARLKECKTYNLGAGNDDVFDITYFVIAIFIVAVAVLGFMNMVFLVAAARYIFMGTRIGGKRV